MADVNSVSVPEWVPKAHAALAEAQNMSVAIRDVVDAVIEQELAPKAYGLLQAIIACTHRLESHVDPMLDRGPEVSHG
jgi:hypothetical protein